LFNSQAVKEDRKIGAPLLPEELWERVKKYLLADKPKLRGSRPRLADRQALIEILFVAGTGRTGKMSAFHGIG